MLGDWRSFYQTTGGAAATLIGLLFVVVSLSRNRDTSAANSGARLFLSPTVFHLTSVLVLSALALAAGTEIPPPCALMTAWAVFGFVNATIVAVGIAAIPTPTHWTDFWWYGVTPAVIFAAIAAACVMAWTGSPHGAYFIGVGLLALLVAAVRNAWDLVTWLAPRRDG
jgi:hypothetical protein